VEVIMKTRFTPAAVLLLALGPVAARAQWQLDGAPVCNAANGQGSTQIVSDGTTGAIITWTDARNATVDIFAQRVDTGGNALWTPNGIAVCDGRG
jgi:hypothetical protein